MNLENEKGIDEILSSLSLKDETFRRKEEIGNLLAREREKQRVELERQRMHRFYWSMAASVAVLFTFVGSWLYNDITIETRQQEFAVSLPDGSHVELMQHSTLHYNRLKWYFSRNVSFSGSACFAVAKGAAFTVDTQAGSVSVLGTRFKIMQQGDEMQVDCMAGSVWVKTLADNKVLKAGQSADCTPHSITLVEQSGELPEYLMYDNVPLLEVVEEIEALYLVNIEPKELCYNVYYTGGVATGNLEEALEVVFGSCNMSYSVQGNNIKIKKSKKWR